MKIFNKYLFSFVINLLLRYFSTTSNSISITHNINKVPKIRIRFLFIYLKFLFENSNNKKNEKDMCNNLLSRIIINSHLHKIRYSFSHYAFYNQIIEFKALIHTSLFINLL